MDYNNSKYSKSTAPDKPLLVFLLIIGSSGLSFSSSHILPMRDAGQIVHLLLFIIPNFNGESLRCCEAIMKDKATCPEQKGGRLWVGGGSRRTAAVSLTSR